jgi:hypothetical protein
MEDKHLGEGASPVTIRPIIVTSSRPLCDDASKAGRLVR